MTQTAFIERMLKKFGWKASAKRRYTPADVKPDEDMCPQTQEDIQFMLGKPYKELIGTLLYLVVCTRPDIAFITCALARYSSNPGRLHWRAATTVLKYLKHTKDMGLYFKAGTKGDTDANGIVIAPLSLWTDSSYLGGDEGRTTLGECLFSGDHLIHWRSSLSANVPQSVAEAEIMAANSGAKEWQWATQVVEGVFSQGQPTILYIDCQPAIDSIVSGKIPRKIRHLKSKYYFVRDLYAEGVLIPEWVDSGMQRADILTKVRANPVFSELRVQCGLE